MLGLGLVLGLQVVLGLSWVRVNVWVRFCVGVGVSVGIDFGSSYCSVGVRVTFRVEVMPFLDFVLKHPYKRLEILHGGSAVFQVPVSWRFRDFEGRFRGISGACKPPPKHSRIQCLYFVLYVLCVTTREATSLLFFTTHPFTLNHPGHVLVWLCRCLHDGLTALRCATLSRTGEGGLQTVSGVFGFFVFLYLVAPSLFLLFTVFIVFSNVSLCLGVASFVQQFLFIVFFHTCALTASYYKSHFRIPFVFRF